MGRIEDLTMSFQLETDRLILRTPVLDDAPEWAEKINRIEIAENMVNMPFPYTVENATDLIRKLLDSEPWIDKKPLCICLKNTGELIGGCNLMAIDAKHRKAFIGFWCIPEMWGNGYITEAALRVVKYGFEECDLERIEARCMALNQASARVLEKLGMVHEYTARRDVFRFDKFYDMKYYSVLRSDWDRLVGE